MQMFSVGRSTVREAKRTLLGRNLIDSHPGRGTVLTAVTADKVVDAEVMGMMLANDALVHLQEMRMLLEPEIAALAAQRASEEDFRGLEQRVTALETMDTPEQLHQGGAAFHTALAEATHNPVLTKLYKVLFSLVLEAHVSVYPIDREFEVHIHRVLLNAIKSRNARRARTAAREHIRAVRMRYRLHP